MKNPPLFPEEPKIETMWRGLTYTNTSLSTVSDDFLEQLKLASMELSEIQRSKLESRLRDLFQHLSNPTFDGYYRLKTKGLAHQFVLSPRGKALLEKHGPTYGTNVAESQWEVSKTLWDVVHAQAGTNRAPRFGAICLERVERTLAYTNSGYAMLHGKATKGFTVAIESMNPGFIYPSPPPGKDGTTNSPVFFEFSFFAKDSGLRTAGPVHISLYWLEQDQNWALNRLIADQFVRYETLF